MTVFSELAKAIRSGEAVEFGYKKLDAKAYEKRAVEPWYLACLSGQWYLLGHDRTRKARRIFVIALCGRSREPAKSFPIHGSAKRRFNASSKIVFKSGKAKTLTWSKSSFDSQAVPRSTFANGIGILVLQVSDWGSGAAAYFGWMSEEENTRCGL